MLAEGFYTSPTCSCLILTSRRCVDQCKEILFLQVCQECFAINTCRVDSNKFEWMINSLRLSDAYIYQYTRPSLVEIVVCCLFGTKPLSEPMLPYWYLDPWGKNHSNLNQNTTTTTKINFKMLSVKWWPFGRGFNVLILCNYKEEYFHCKYDLVKPHYRYIQNIFCKLLC